MHILATTFFAMAKISLISVNVQGLGNQQKRRDVFHYLRQKNSSIYFLQDTHFTNKQEQYIRSEWGYECYFNNYNSQSRGVAILFNNNFDFKVKKVIKDNSGNFLILLINTMQRDLVLANIYGPNTDDPNFYQTVQNHLDQLTHSGIVMSGDWNLVLNPSLDYHNYKNINNVKAQEKVIEMMENNCLCDVWRELNSETLRYTWRRKTPFQQARLDFFLVSETLLLEVKDVDILLSYRSDHSMISLELEFNQENKKHSNFWKFNNSLLKDKNYVTEINKILTEVKCQYSLPVYNHDNIDKIYTEDLQFTIPDQLFLDTLIMEVRKKTIEYSAKKKKEDIKLETELETNIFQIEQKPLLSDSEKIELEDKKKELIELRKKKIEGVMIRSKARWSAEGEKITKYFCNLEKRHFVSKQMFKLVDSKGEIINKTDDMLNETKLFYENLYEDKPNTFINSEEFFTEAIPKLDNYDSNTLEGLISLEEASNALKNMNNGKSPGSDGMSVDFFKFFWKQLGGFVVRSLNEGFMNNQMSITQREGIIVCIPKGDKPREYIKNWRPISLLNVVYKIGSTCIANRIKTVLPQLISEDQTGFVPGRYIGDNVRLIYDLIYHLNENDLPGLLVSIDFEKAFDSVNWTYMNRVLRAFGFGNDICQWISAFYTNIKSSVIVNGKSSSFFDIKRGCRQGDPISPYLFILCAEILAIRIRNEKQIKGITLSDTECKISQFADDTTFMLQGDQNSFENCFLILEKFQHLSGLKINYDKTFNVWLGSKKYCRTKFLNQYDMNWNPGRFKLLGLWFTNDTDNMAEINLNEKFNETKKLFEVWMRRTITPLGKIAVLKSLILSKLTYLWLLLPNPPQQMIDKIQELCYKFVWNNKHDKVKRTLVVHSIEDGGLGLPYIYTQIRALKLTWLKKCIKNHNSKWTALLHKTCPAVTMLKEYGPQVLLRKENINPFWKDVFTSYTDLYNHTELTSNEDILFEPIFYNHRFKVGTKTIYHKDWACNDIFFVKDLIKDSGNFLSLNEFTDKINTQTPFLSFYGCIDSIKQYLKKHNITIENKDTEEKEQNKVYSMIETAPKGAQYFYKCLLPTKFIPKACTNWDFLLDKEIQWNKVFLTTKKIDDIKLKWFQLRINNRILVTNNVLKEMNVLTSNKCSFCHIEKDSVIHYLWSCEHVQHFWNDLLQILKEKCQNCVRLEFNPCIILFNHDDKTILDNIMIKILLSAKFFIYKCRINKTMPSVNAFLVYLKQVYIIDKFASYMRMNNNKHNVSWISYMNLLQ